MNIEMINALLKISEGIAEFAHAASEITTVNTTVPEVMVPEVKTNDDTTQIDFDTLKVIIMKYASLNGKDKAIEILKSIAGVDKIKDINSIYYTSVYKEFTK
jgi:hypothetical protein